MARLLSADIWKQAAEHLKQRDLKIAAIAYVSLYSPIFREGDILICDASEGAIECNQTKASILRKYFDNKVKIYSVENLHAKLVYTSTTLIIGSSNLSNNSAVNLIEAALLTNETSSIAQAEGFCYPFIDEKYELTHEKLKKLELIKSIRQTRKYKGVPKERKRTFGGETWIISTTNSKVDKYYDEIDLTTSLIAKKHKLRPDKIEPLIWPKDSFSTNAKIGNMVICIHEYGSRSSVNSPCTIVKIDEKADWMLIYLTQPKKYKSIYWTAFNKQIKGFNLNRKITKSSCRPISQNDYDQLHSILK